MLRFALCIVALLEFYPPHCDEGTGDTEEQTNERKGKEQLPGKYHSPHYRQGCTQLAEHGEVERDNDDHTEDSANDPDDSPFYHKRGSDKPPGCSKQFECLDLFFSAIKEYLD